MEDGLSVIGLVNLEQALSMSLEEESGRTKAMG